MNYRKHNPVLQGGKMTHFFPQDGVYSYVRSLKSGEQNQQLWVFLSKNTAAKSIEVEHYAELSPDKCIFKDVVNGKQYAELSTVIIPAQAWLMLECQPK